MKNLPEKQPCGHGRGVCQNVFGQTAMALSSNLQKSGAQIRSYIHTLFGVFYIFIFNVFVDRLLVALNSGDEFVHYFAYDSDMHSSRLAEHGLKATNLGVAALPGYSINYSKKSQDGTGECNIEKAEGGLVYGVVFLVPIREVYKINKASGGALKPPRHACKHVIVMVGGREIEAFTYVAKPEFVAASSFLAPSAEYAGLVVSAAEQNGLPLKYVAHLRESAEGHVEAYRLN